jgi:hypothetical protein
MSDHYRERIPRDLHQIAELLEAERPEMGPLKLDRIKLQAQARTSAARGRPALIGRGNGFMRSRVVSLLVVAGLLGGGTGAMAAAGGPSPFRVFSSDHEGASNSEYCPPTSHAPGKPKKPGPAKCGHEPGDDEGDNGDEGNGNGNDNGDEQGHGHGHGNGHGDAVTRQGDGPGHGHGKGKNH